MALRLIVEREREINAFDSRPYFRVEGVFVPEKLKGGRSSANKVTGVLDRRFDSQQEAEAFLDSCRGCVFTIGSVEKKEVSRCPAPPFTTSSLQQEAARTASVRVRTDYLHAYRLHHTVEGGDRCC